jgi:phosphate transport system substrate-binding protein
METTMNFMKAIVAAGLVAASTSAFAADITGAGATFPFPLYSKWADAYKKETGNGLNYQSIGSGAGIKQIVAKTVTFGASDMPLKPEQLEKDGMIQWPQAMGALVPVVNLEGIKPGELVFSGELLGDIYLGKIKKWDDPAIAKLNPKVKLPSDAITVVRRSDGSGTTFIWTDYLSKTNAEWKTKAGAGTAVEWPTGVGAKGNEGVAGNVSQTKNSIGYVEYAYAKQNKMAHALIANKDGVYNPPAAKSFQAAAANADWKNAPGYYLLLTDQPGQASWPITGASFILMHKTQEKPESAKELLRFFDWSYRNGGAMAEALDYVPMPDPVVAMVEESWKTQLAGPDGEPVWTGPAP